MSSVLVDTSVWLRFLAGREPFASQLGDLLDRQEVIAHQLVHGELLVGESGRSRSRSALLKSYDKLPYAASVAHSEVVELVIARDMRGEGIGWIDAHLVASALVSKVQLWTADANLRIVAERLRIAVTPEG